MAIALVRPQAEHTKPPRALWVPFELGRPFGPPSDPAFQKRVILAALRLLEAEAAAGPVLLADFPDDDPRETPDPNWRPPILHSGDGIEAEIAALKPAFEQSRAERGRSTVGLTPLGRRCGGCLRRGLAARRSARRARWRTCRRSCACALRSTT